MAKTLWIHTDNYEHMNRDNPKNEKYSKSYEKISEGLNYDVLYAKKLCKTIEQTILKTGLAKFIRNKKHRLYFYLYVLYMEKQYEK